ncbi:hypothetical protein [Geminicoccus flavidas]|uniref:hypothetical protein n=1 Tax=Geminicoccus flavidas TaxID=2506407 RepID=UPI00135AAF72|nr:hypothetical protein [Geminicoccus flavidas]
MFLMDMLETLLRALGGMCSRIIAEARERPGLTTLLVAAAILGSGGAVLLALAVATVAYVLLGGIRRDRMDLAVRQEQALHRHVFGD